MPLMGQREYARHRKCALRAVQKAIEAGRIKTQKQGTRSLIDSDQADRDWQVNTDPAKRSLLHAAGPAADPSPADSEDQETAGDDAPPADGGNEIYRKARGEREQIRLDKERYELEQLRGQLIDVAEARRLAFTAFRTLRDAVLNVPARVKDQCASETDALRIEQLLDAELSVALAQLDPERVLNEIEDEDDED